MCRLMLDAGLRAGEVVAIRPEHLDMTTCKLTVREGKGAKDRTVWISGDLRDLIGEWLERRPESDWLFCTRDGGQVGTRYLREMVKRQAKKAQVQEWERVSGLEHDNGLHTPGERRGRGGDEGPARWRRGEEGQRG